LNVHEPMARRAYCGRSMAYCSAIKSNEA
jgi:hypothetical protein